jgi:hypothetical protein
MRICEGMQSWWWRRKIEYREAYFLIGQKFAGVSRWPLSVWSLPVGSGVKKECELAQVG